MDEKITFAAYTSLVNKNIELEKENRDLKAKLRNRIASSEALGVHVEPFDNFNYRFEENNCRAEQDMKERISMKAELPNLPFYLHDAEKLSNKIQ